MDASLLLPLILHSSDVIGILERNGTLRHGLPLEALGYPPEQTAGQFAMDYIHPDERDEAFIRLFAALETPGVTPPFECRLRTADGGWKWFEMAAANALEDPEIEGLVFTGRDIDDRKRAEQELHDSERRWRRLLQSTNEHVTVMGRDGTFIAHVGTGSLLGFESGELLDFGMVLERTHPDDAQAAMAMFADILTTPGARRSIVARIQHRDGSWHFVESVGYNLIDDPDVGGVLVTSRDVTEREEASRKTEAIERRWRRIMRSSSEPVTVVAPNKRLIQTTANGRMLGYDGCNAPTPEQPLELVHPDDADIAEAGFQRALSAPGEHPPYVVRIRHADGEWRWIESTLVNLLHDPDVQGIVITSRDVTAHRDAEEVRRAAEAEIKSSERRWKRMFASTTEQSIVIGADGTVLAHTGTGFLFGYEDDSWDVARALDLIHPDDRERAAQAWAQLLTTPGEHPRLVVRMRHDDGTWRWVENIPANLLHDPDVRGIVVVSRDITSWVAAEEARLRAEARLAHHTTHDPLTELPNRTLLLDRLRQAVARLGGDEFVVVCEQVNGEIEAVAVADRIAEALTPPIRLGDAELTLTASIGIAVATDPATDAAALMRDVGSVMYRAKQRGRNRWDVVDDAVRSHAAVRLSTETELRRALDGDELSLSYQPVVSLDDGQLVGAESLMRWTRPGSGYVAPSEFIPVAEESGLIVPLGRLALREGCEQLARWGESTDWSKLVVSVNVSAVQLSAGDIVSIVGSALSATGADPGRLALEITETALLTDLDVATRTLQKLRRLGVQLWIDDFGTGYSSLAYLRQLPLDGLKIDASFVAGLSTTAVDRAIVAGIVDVAHSLGLVAIAEGVETAEQAAVLRDLGCDRAQGYHWSQPVTAGDLEAWRVRHVASS